MCLLLAGNTAIVPPMRITDQGTSLPSATTRSSHTDRYEQAITAAADAYLEALSKYATGHPTGGVARQQGTTHKALP